MIPNNISNNVYLIALSWSPKWCESHLPTSFINVLFFLTTKRVKCLDFCLTVLCYQGRSEDGICREIMALREFPQFQLVDQDNGQLLISFLWLGFSQKTAAAFLEVRFSFGGCQQSVSLLWRNEIPPRADLLCDTLFDLRTFSTFLPPFIVWSAKLKNAPFNLRRPQLVWDAFFLFLFP